MIASVEIQNLRGIREGRLEGLTPLVILTGPNGCGKSTVLDALVIGVGSHLEAGVAVAVQRHPGTWLGVDFLVKRGTSATVTIGALPEGTVGVVLSNERLAPGAEPDGWRVPARSVGIGAIRDGVRHGQSTRLVVGADGSCQGTNPRWSGLLDLPVALIDPSIFRDLGQEWTEVVRAGRKKAVIDLLAEVVPWANGLESLQEEGGRSQLYGSGESGAVPVNLLGDGVAALLHLAIRIAPLDGGLVLVEEPEVFQHPRALRLTARLLVAAMRRGAQVILTTHSAELIQMIVGESDPEDQDRMSLFNLALEGGNLRVARHAGEVLSYGARQAAESLR